ncbi:MAG: chloride channel protein [Gammaproteobacteria bacterium]|nr:chloride channel protein [Gammaproteobacteria bacterium]MCF6363979.1 chloride channel protein [Gammaproteobacteria bacterium]
MLDKLRAHLAHADALPILAVLGLCSGLLAGGVIVLFRILIDSLQMNFLPGGDVENYEGLSAFWRFSLPALGGLLIGLLFQLAGGAQVGVVHVLERLAYFQGHLPLRNMLLQFIGATMSIVSGHSVGREGPSVHLGAASGSLLGQALKLPNNSIQILLACGAAAIAASFNTPIAGVIFAMEVILMEYTIVGFAPVILAAVTATAVSRMAFGAAPAFIVPPMDMASLLELPYMLVMGIAIGALAAVFIGQLQRVTLFSARFPIWQRMTLAGIFVGLCGLFVPAVMGIGYDTVNAAILGELGLSFLLLVMVFKVLATTVGLGMGLPGGLIGPTLVIGACAALGIAAEYLFPGQVASPGFYAMLGMGAMMSATLQAPLAALMALLELTYNPHIILPGMLVVVISDIIASHVFGRDSVFLTLLRARGLDYRSNPVAQALRRVGVASVMNTSLVTATRTLSRQTAEDLLTSEPLHVLVLGDEQPVSLLLAADLARHLAAHPDEVEVDLLRIPARRDDIRPISMQATLQQALDEMDEHNVDALYVIRGDDTIGSLSRQSVEAHYR